MSTAGPTRVLVLTVGDRRTASIEYRLAQYELWLQTHGVELSYRHQGEVNRDTAREAGEADVLFNQKCLFRAGWAKAQLQAARRTVFDIDDAIYTRPGRPHFIFTSWRVRYRLHLWLRRSDTVVAANHYLGDYCRRYTDRVVVLQNALDLERWRPVAKSRAPGVVRLGWAGSPATVPHLESIGAALAKVLARFPQVEMAVFSGKKPQLPVPFTYVPYQPGEEVGFTQQLDIGLLPLTDEDYGRGKSPIKAIQYLACGVPVVGNLVGAATEICRPECSVNVTTPTEWCEALSALVSEPDQVLRLGHAGRQHVEQHHDFQKNARQLLAIIRGELAG